VSRRNRSAKHAKASRRRAVSRSRARAGGERRPGTMADQWASFVREHAQAQGAAPGARRGGEVA
jgi:hypothetical protein